ncbi:hypothetical protein QC764_0079010 [Podospora pseudoanserina]|uniref:Uncharacterized protein n=1 Tax=Podospora pseudoanserina TaxID=2609844 RepID=A0ABR0I5J8_9PEZI|nr:hypothetical protein QC764_0079010 [Podospora pseudoanserina]
MPCGFQRPHRSQRSITSKTGQTGLQLIVAKHQAGRDPAQSRIPMDAAEVDWAETFPQRNCRAHDSHNNHPRGGRSKKICYAPELFSFNFANRITNNGRQILWHAFAFRIRLELMLEPKRPLEPDPVQPAPDVCEVGKSAIPPSIPAHPSFAQVSPDRRVFLAARDGSHSGHGNPIMGANLACHLSSVLGEPQHPLPGSRSRVVLV